VEDRPRIVEDVEVGLDDRAEGRDMAGGRAATDRELVGGAVGRYAASRRVALLDERVQECER
jgi:hypothetical protein